MNEIILITFLIVMNVIALGGFIHISRKAIKAFSPNAKPIESSFIDGDILTAPQLARVET